ncbi:translation initiation factor IF-3 [Pelagicoccus sp. NFK12]|uniref:Translation initiation factor IF-3 n=1 Tax=Pelagicoccus enzymogenes TaxID=2773457 RepID=A0A927F8Y2_9BACT|nr:translation initiation factor IF-3 [Pelagicoccus enzymogenes]MBD5780519.1 translation initiation factor IF-3 [Pelagicoccus enzymogenes]MDQ8197581.1 translation initiation factor IF-3 [Pelagicoccus enzymogenes]
MPKPRGKRRPPRKLDPFAQIRRNHRIRVPKIRVVGPDGKQYGVMDTKEALEVAQGAGLDLVEVAAQARPPVCRIMDFGKYVYEQQKKSKDNKSTSSKVKEVKFRPRVEQHDYETKLRRAELFLSKGNKLKLTLSFRGREMSHTEIGFETIRRAIADLETMGHADNQPRLTGRNINVMVSPLPANKRKPKFLREDDDHDEIEASEHHDEDHSDDDVDDVADDASKE